MTVVWTRAHIQSSALFASLHPVLAGVNWPHLNWPTLDDYQALLSSLPAPILTACGIPLRVKSQAIEKPHDWRLGYEPRIYLTGELQTRTESWHDFFNLLVWASFPQSKAALNARQYALLESRAQHAPPSAARLAPQDALTQFDESGVIIVSADEGLSDLLRNFAWKELFWTQRNAVQSHMRCYLFGHGLMEKALTPYRGMTGKGIVLPVDAGFFSQTATQQLAQLDTQLARLIIDPQQVARPQDLAPVPVLGFPGFAAENEQPAYYNDQAYFRPGRSAMR